MFLFSDEFLGIFVVFGEGDRARVEGGRAAVGGGNDELNFSVEGFVWMREFGLAEGDVSLSLFLGADRRVYVGGWGGRVG